MVINMLTQERLKYLFFYNKRNGVFSRKKQRYHKSKQNTKVGCFDSNGYVLIGVDNKRYRAHRLAWLYVHGYFPEQIVDHINMDRSDNRIENLRLASKSCNAQNSKTQINNKTGRRGVWFCKRRCRYIAEIKVVGKKHYLGSYSSFEDAKKAREVFEKESQDWECG